jgi:transcriptional regulator CtsR
MMKYVIEERFTDELGFTFEKAQGGGHGGPITFLYFMRKDNSQSVFELIEKEQYDIAYWQYRENFMARLSGEIGA